MTMDSNTESNQNTFFSLLTKCPAERLHKLFHHFVDQFCGQEISVYKSFTDIYSMVEWWNLIDQSKSFLKKYYIEENQTLESLESLPSESQKIIKDVLEVRSSDLKDELLEKTHAVAPAYLKSFDWKVKMTLASDKMSQINEPKLSLDLDIAADKDKFLQLDLSKNELEMLIDAMEKAKRNIVQLMKD